MESFGMELWEEIIKLLLDTQTLNTSRCPTELHQLLHQLGRCCCYWHVLIQRGYWWIVIYFYSSTSSTITHSPAVFTWLPRLVCSPFCSCFDLTVSHLKYTSPLVLHWRTLSFSRNNLIPSPFDAKKIQVFRYFPIVLWGTNLVSFNE